ncbi:MAG: hypothetical protein KAI38_11065, partial [Candidatus Latescibacteria bacterium]|nr:hypothetical protein [Candidatus Latescibacterota bacterium]
NEMIETEIPSFRPDIEREIDLVEEVARIVGYNNIPNREVGGGSLWVATRTDLRLASRTRAVLTGLGLDEVVTSSLTDPDRASEDAVRLANPSGRPMSVLRTDLISGLLEVARWNLNRQAGAVRIFEIGKVFAPGAGPSGTEEEERVAGVLVCETRRDHWHEKKQALDFYDVKGIVEAYLDSMAQAELEVAPVQDRWYEEGVAGKILLGGKEVGRCGRLHRDVLERFDFGEAVYGFDVSLSEVLPFFEEVRTFELLARYPAVDRDFAVVVPESLSWGELLGEIRETDTGLIESVEMFDVYRGKPLGEGEKSLAFSVRFRSKERTLSEVEVGALCDRIVERLSERFGARLRS